MFWLALFSVGVVCCLGFAFGAVFKLRLVKCCKRFPGFDRLKLLRKMKNGWEARECPHCESVYLIDADPVITRYKVVPKVEWNEANIRVRGGSPGDAGKSGTQTQQRVVRQAATRFGVFPVRKG